MTKNITTELEALFLKFTANDRRNKIYCDAQHLPQLGYLALPPRNIDAQNV